MKYMGSKNKYAREILPIILHSRLPDQAYIEPFCGGCNTIDKVFGVRYANDTHTYLIEFLKALQRGWLPPQNISEELYRCLQLQPEQYDKALVGYAGFQLSYGGKWFGGYRRDKVGKRNYSLEAYRNTIQQIQGIKGILFSCMDYREIQIPQGSVVYADPPYANSTSYKTDFNHNDFWKWSEYLVNNGHQLFVSEYDAPDGWNVVWQKQVNNSLTKDTGSKTAVEKLFVHHSQSAPVVAGFRQIAFF